MYARCGSMPDARQVFDAIEHPNVVSWTALILGYAECGEGLVSLQMFVRMTSEGHEPDSVTFVAALKACTSLEGAECGERGKAVHNLSVDSGCNPDIYLQSTLIDMYTKCGSLAAAHQVFDSIKHPNVVSWTALIVGYADIGQALAGLNLFAKMRSDGPAPDSVTFVAALKACASLNVKERRRHCGEALHNLAVQNGCTSNGFVQSSLIDMYAKCYRLTDARQVFDSRKNPDIVCWTALILGYAENGESLIALQLFSELRGGGLEPRPLTFVAALKACSSFASRGTSEGGECRDRGMEIHNLAVQSGCISDIYVQNTLIDMYSSAGSMVEAWQVFCSMKHPNVVSWTALISGYVENGQALTALNVFTRMQEDIAPDSVTLVAALKACSLLGALEFGRSIHREIGNAHLDVILLNSLVDFYAKCGSLAEAQSIFDGHPKTADVITWNALLAGFSSCGDSESVFRAFRAMQDAGVQPNAVTFLAMLACCSHAGLVDKAKESFQAMQTQYGIAPAVEHYTCMIDGFGRANRLDEAMRLLVSMRCSPDDATWRIILGACCKWKNLRIGKLAFQALVFSNDGDAGAYVVMGKIYGSSGLLQEQASLMEMCRKLSNNAVRARTAWTNELGEVHSF